MRVEGVGLRVDLARGVSAAPVGVGVDAVGTNVVLAGPQRRGAHERRNPLRPTTHDHKSEGSSGSPTFVSLN